MLSTAVFLCFCRRSLFPPLRLFHHRHYYYYYYDYDYFSSTVLSQLCNYIFRINEEAL